MDTLRKERRDWVDLTEALSLRLEEIEARNLELESWAADARSRIETLEAALSVAREEAVWARRHPFRALWRRRIHKFQKSLEKRRR